MFAGPATIWKQLEEPTTGRQGGKSQTGTAQRRSIKHSPEPPGEKPTCPEGVGNSCQRKTCTRMLRVALANVAADKGEVHAGEIRPLPALPPEVQGRA